MKRVWVIHHGPMAIPHPHYQHNNWIAAKKESDDPKNVSSLQQFHLGTTVTQTTQNAEVKT